MSLATLDGELSRWRGSVDAKLDRLISDLESDRLVADEYRSKMQEVITALSQSMRDCATQIKVLSPDVKDYVERRAEFRGAAKLSRLVIGGFMAMSAVIGAAASEVARRWH